jgi:colanic acid/amylovoran biosynthesis protein
MKNSSTARQEKFLIGPAALDCNRGDQALMWEAIDALRKASPDCDIAIMSDNYNDPEDMQSRQTRKLGVSVLPALLPNPRRVATRANEAINDSGWSLLKVQLRAILDFVQMQGLLAFPLSRGLARLFLGETRFKTYEYLLQCNAIVIKGGGYIYAYRGLRWIYYIWFGLFSLMLAQHCGVKVFILPNSFGPFESGLSRWLARRVLGRCDIIAAREPKSYEVLNTIIPGKAKLFPDMAFNLQPADREWAKQELISGGVALGKKQCVGITMRPWRFPNAEYPQGKYEKYVQAFGHLCKYLMGKGYMPVLFVHTTGPHAHENDRIALKAVLEEIPQPLQVPYIDGDYNCREIKALYGHMDFMISTRFHSAIFSIAQQVPCLAVSYQGYKTTGIMGEIGLDDFVIPIDEIDDNSLIEGFETLVANQQEIKQKMKAYMADYQQRLNQLDGLLSANIRETSGNSR